MSENILEIKGLTKRFSGVCALHDVSFSIKAGEVRALMGENGAGKSTLIKIITGLYSSDEGVITFDGENRTFHSVLEAQHAGISTVFQELNMIPYLSVSENIFLGRYPYRNGGIDWKSMHQQAQALVDELGVHIDVQKPLNFYNTAKQQIISIIRAVNFESKMIILDEPTSSLDTNEVELLFRVMDQLKEKGTAIIFISHRIDEVYRKCDSITILKDGELVGTYPSAELSQYELLSKMIGNKNFELRRMTTEKKLDELEEVLRVENLYRKPFVNGVSFQVKKGEILGLAGLLGSGRTETARLIFGCDQMDSGEIYINGEKKTIKNPEAAVQSGIAFCTENRREEGLFPNLSITKNLSICSLKTLEKHFLIDQKKRTALTKEYIGKIRIKASSELQMIKNLSGGNQQKVILSRWIATNPKVLIMDEPTRGIDVGAKAEIEKLIRELAEQGMSIILISSEMMELVRNCDRVVVLRDGKVRGTLTGKEISEENMMKTIAEGTEE